MQKANTALDLLIKQEYQMLITIEDVAKILGLTTKTVRNQMANGRFPIKTGKYGGARRIDIRELARYLDSGGYITKKRKRGRPKKTEQVSGLIKGPE